MLTRVFAVGLLAGLLADAAAPSTFAPARLILVHDTHEHADATSDWTPTDGLERTLFTTIATIGTAVGFALILIAGMLGSGDRTNERSAMAWGAAGFAAAGLAPAYFVGLLWTRIGAAEDSADGL